MHLGEKFRYRIEVMGRDAAGDEVETFVLERKRLGFGIGGANVGEAALGRFALHHVEHFLSNVGRPHTRDMWSESISNVAATGGDLATTGYAILWASAFLSAIVDNIPFVATMIPLIKSMAPAFGGADKIEPLWWCLSLGACLGARTRTGPCRGGFSLPVGFQRLPGIVAIRHRIDVMEPLGLTPSLTPGTCPVTKPHPGGGIPLRAFHEPCPRIHRYAGGLMIIRCRISEAEH